MSKDLFVSGVIYLQEVGFDVVSLWSSGSVLLPFPHCRRRTRIWRRCWPLEVSSGFNDIAKGWLKSVVAELMIAKYPGTGECPKSRIQTVRYGVLHGWSVSP